MIRPSDDLPRFKPYRCFQFFSGVFFFSFFTITHTTAQTTDFVPITLTPQVIKNESITFTEITEGTLSRMLPVMSRVQSDMTHTVAIQAAGSGKITRIMVLPGQNVRQGQPLIDYQNHTLHIASLQKAQAITALAAAQAAEAEAQAAYKRATLLAGETISAGEKLRRQATLQQTRQNVAARKAELAMLNHQFEEEYTSDTEKYVLHDETSTIIAPFPGTITKLSTTVAANVTPEQPLITVSDTDHVWIISDITPQDAALIKPGAQQYIQTHSATLSAPIETVDSVADPLTGLSRVLTRIKNTGNFLRSGMVLNSMLQTTSVQNGLIAPAESLQKIGDKTFVFLKISNSQIQAVPVTASAENNGKVIITAGLKPGDIIADHGSLALKAMMILPGMSDD